MWVDKGPNPAWPITILTRTRRKISNGPPGPVVQSAPENHHGCDVPGASSDGRRRHVPVFADRFAIPHAQRSCGRSCPMRWLFGFQHGTIYEATLTGRRYSSTAARKTRDLARVESRSISRYPRTAGLPPPTVAGAWVASSCGSRQLNARISCGIIGKRSSACACANLKCAAKRSSAPPSALRL